MQSPRADFTLHVQIVHSCLYKILDFDNVSLHLTDMISLKTFKISFDKLKFFRLGYAMTYQQSQGKTFRERTRLHDINNPNFSWRHFVVGLSRVDDAKILDINNE